VLVTSGRSGALPRPAPVPLQSEIRPEDGDKGLVRNHSAASISISPWADWIGGSPASEVRARMASSWYFRLSAPSPPAVA